MSLAVSRDRHHEAAAFAELALRLHVVRDLDELVATIVTAAQETFGCDLAAVAVLGPRQQVRSVDGPAADLVEAAVATGTGAWWTALTTRSIQHEDEAVVHAPITPGSGRPSGLLSLWLTEPVDLRRISHFCTYAGIALEGLWYQERLRRSMDTHATVGSGIGMLMERYSLDRGAAYDVMSKIAIEDGVRLKEIAQRLREVSAE
ncbi:GAF and ANTAR domain-containing protein [Kribbella sp. NPDC051587]|uniref:GAF and ANTAR domain-containing protein n=1 Tax=Kribbella sp. NPDC051587 TaxID=3364119 RepID=UPI0037BBDB92